MKFLNVIFKGHSISELIQEVIYVFIALLSKEITP